MQSTYKKEDVTLLLKDITGIVSPQPAEIREVLIQKGIHYSEMLPLEYKPSRQYMDAYQKALLAYAKETALAVCRTAEQIYQLKGNRIVLASLARAGISAGILIKHYLEKKYSIQIPHYAVSIIRGKGIDEAAMQFILKQHPPASLQFVDGWTGKGAIQNELKKALKKYSFVSDALAVLSDPANITDICGTHEDILIPSSCLNSTISGLISRTFHKEGIINPGEFHGAAFYGELFKEDLTYAFIDEIEQYFDYHAAPGIPGKETKGTDEAAEIARHYAVPDIHLVKPGIGESTRVLLRRIPWKLVIRENASGNPLLFHLLALAKEKNVEVEEYPLKNYLACGIIKQMPDT